MSAASLPQVLSLAFDGDSLWAGTSVGVLVHLKGLTTASAPSLRGDRAGEPLPIRDLAVSKSGEVALAQEGGRISVLQGPGSRVEFALDGGMDVAGLAWRQAGLVLVDMRRQVRLAERGADGLWIEARPSSAGRAGPRWRDKTLGVDALAVRADGSLALLDALAFGIWEPGTLAVQAWHQPVDGMRLVYLDGLVGLNASGTHAYMHWDDFLIFDVATGKLTYEGWVEPETTCLALSHHAAASCLGRATGAVAVRDHASGQAVSVQVSSFPLVEIVAHGSGSLWAWRDAQGGFGIIDAAGHEVVSRKRAEQFISEIMTQIKS